MQIIQYMDLVALMYTYSFTHNPLKQTLFYQKTTEGMTGRIIFDYDGHRTNFYIEVLELNQEGFTKIATWDAITGINYTRSQSEVYSQITQSLHNKTVVVSVRLGGPYLFIKLVLLNKFLLIYGKSAPSKCSCIT